MLLCWLLLSGRMLIEKLMSGLYMGECARRLLLSFAQRAQLFGDASVVIPEELGKKDSFSTAGKACTGAACQGVRW